MNEITDAPSCSRVVSNDTNSLGPPEGPMVANPVRLDCTIIQPC